MKQTISVNLNRQIYYLDTDAYQELEKYLEAIKKCFKRDSAEVVNDIEARIAEKFDEIVGKSKKAIQLSDVEKIIEEMGTVDDITDEKKEGEEEEDNGAKKKLFRDSETKIIAGVAAGVAWYLGVKSIWIRIALIILLVTPATFWLALVGYLAAWLVIPEAKNNWEKLEMKGKPATVDELQNAMEEKDMAVVSGVEARTRSWLQKMFSILGRLIRFFFVGCCRLTGLFTILGVICLIVVVVLGLVTIYFEPAIPYFDFSFLGEIGRPFLEIMFVALGVAFVTPLVFLMDLAVSLMRWKWLVSVKKLMIMMLVWIVAVVVFAGVTKFNYPKFGPKMTTSLNRVKYLTWIDDTNFKNLEVKEIEGIKISAVREVVITQGAVNEVKIWGNQYAIDELKIGYADSKLEINGYSRKWFDCHDCSGYVSPVRVEITAKDVKEIRLDDDIDALYYPATDKIKIEVGKKVGLKILGELNQATVTAGPYSVINLLETNLTEADLTLRRATAKVWAKKIKVDGDSESKLIYRGEPKIVEGEQNKVSRQKYSLSEDDYDKLTAAVKNTVITIGGVKKRIGDWKWNERLAKQSDNNAYNLYTAVKLKEDGVDSYVLWLVEKDGVITLKDFIKMENWERIDKVTVANDKVLSITGDFLGPEAKRKTAELIIDRSKGMLELKKD